MPQELHAVGHSWLFFTADDGSIGRELWRLFVDEAGVVSGPELVKDINVGSCGSNPWQFMATKEEIFFRAVVGPCGVCVPPNEPCSFYQLWRADGRSASQVLSDADWEQALGYYPEKGLVLASAYTATSGNELYAVNVRKPILATDGARTFEVNDSAKSLVAINGKAYFASDDGTGDWELYRMSNGKVERVSDINIGGSSNPRELVVSGGVLYFVADSSGSGAEVFKFNPLSGRDPEMVEVLSGVESTEPAELVAGAPGTVYFVGAYSSLCPSQVGAAKAVYWTDGTQTVCLDGLYDNPRLLTYASGQNRLFFVSYDAAHGEELWWTNSTSTATMVEDIHMGPVDSEIYEMVANGSFVYFSANDGGGSGLWRSDGSVTSRIYYSPPGTAPKNPTNLTVLKLSSGRLLLLFSADTASASQALHRMNTTTGYAESIGGCTNPANFLTNGTSIFFSCFTAADGNELFKVEITPDSLPLPSILRPRVDFYEHGSSVPVPLGFVGSRLYVAATEPVGGRELAMNVITTSTPNFYWDLVPGPMGSDPKDFVAVTGGYAFTALDGATGGRRLYFGDNL